MFQQAVIIWICLESLTVYGQQFYFDQFSISDGYADQDQLDDILVIGRRF
jgi:hypothetical protein